MVAVLNPLRWWRQRKLAQVPIDVAAFEATVCLLPGLQALPAADQQRLLAYVRAFLLDKTIVGAHDFALDTAMRTRIATLACWPVLALGYDWLAGWHEVIVYPEGFQARRIDHDEDTGVVHEWDEELAGESWDQGPLIVSWEDLCTDLAQPEDLQNIVVHEVAHKLDARKGYADGGPPLPPGMDAGQWARVFQRDYDALCALVDRDESQAPIDPYASSAPEEFFAVCSEYHFLAPALLQSAYPEVAALLAQFYAGGSPSISPAARRAASS